MRTRSVSHIPGLHSIYEAENKDHKDKISEQSVHRRELLHDIIDSIRSQKNDEQF